jgi:hypothetical protein
MPAPYRPAYSRPGDRRPDVHRQGADWLGLRTRATPPPFLYARDEPFWIASVWRTGHAARYRTLKAEAGHPEQSNFGAAGAALVADGNVRSDEPPIYFVITITRMPSVNV